MELLLAANCTHAHVRVEYEMVILHPPGIRHMHGTGLANDLPHSTALQQLLRANSSRGGQQSTSSCIARAEWALTFSVLPGGGDLDRERALPLRAESMSCSWIIET